MASLPVNPRCLKDYDHPIIIYTMASLLVNSSVFEHSVIVYTSSPFYGFFAGKFLNVYKIMSILLLFTPLHHFMASSPVNPRC